MEKILLNPEPVRAETPKIHRAVMTALRQRGFSTDDAEIVAMVATELSENAIKYGRYDGAAVMDHFTLEIAGEGNLCVIQVQNPADGSDPNFARLERMIKRIGEAPDPMETFRERVGEIARDGRARGLGLVRIASEGRAELLYTLGDGVLCVSARCRLDSLSF